MAALARSGADAFIDFGPGQVLAKLVRAQPARRARARARELLRSTTRVAAGVEPTSPAEAQPDRSRQAAPRSPRALAARRCAAPASSASAPRCRRGVIPNARDRRADRRRRRVDRAAHRHPRAPLRRARRTRERARERGRADGARGRRRSTAREIDLVLVATLAPRRDHAVGRAARRARAGRRQRRRDRRRRACTGSIAALAHATAWIEAGHARNVLVIGAEILSRFIDHDDRRTAPLFGDGAGALVVSADAAGQIGPFVLGSDGARRRARSASTRERGLLEMEGHETFLAAVRASQRVDRASAAAAPASSSPTSTCSSTTRPTRGSSTAVAERLRAAARARLRLHRRARQHERRERPARARRGRRAGGALQAGCARGARRRRRRAQRGARRDRRGGGS